MSTLRITDRAGRAITPQQAAALNGAIDLRKYLRRPYEPIVALVSWFRGPGPSALALGDTGTAEQEWIDCGSEVDDE